MSRLPLRREVLVALLAFVWPHAKAAAQKPQPAVGAQWAQVPASRPVGQRVRVLLRLTAAEDAPRLTIRLVPTAVVVVVGPTTPRRVGMRKGRTLDIPVTFRVTREGTWTLGASVTNTQPADEQVSGAVLTVIARNGTVSFER